MAGAIPTMGDVERQFFERALAAPRTPDSHFDLYGPLLSMLSSIFKSRPRSSYLITPPYRAQLNKDPIELEGGGALTTACFVIVKFPRKNLVQVMGLHIQRGDETVPAARARVARFLRQKAGEDRVPNLCSILLLGNDVEVYSLTDGSSDAKISDDVMRFSNPAGPELKALLYKIAEENFEEYEV
ncbi:hypothetical protein BDN70DRAFT_596965 [Pholiota conissans]|uniref:Uncharacterized protein n=1 Tax=Pholiota conissans TaxID=109636 RepID=A0A9P6D1R8_9AGAR|nr:hypothetical protein BDN70DRAFT_596965 [Pholiota conissans]